MSESKKPAGYEDDLSGYGPVAFDTACGEPVAWGFTILRHLGEDRFNALAKFGKLECVGHRPGSWALVTKRLTRDEAIARYGPITEEPRGPRGGWRSITFGKTKFFSRLEPVGA